MAGHTVNLVMPDLAADEPFYESAPRPAAGRGRGDGHVPPPSRPPEPPAAAPVPDPGPARDTTAGASPSGVRTATFLGTVPLADAVRAEPAWSESHRPRCEPPMGPPGEPERDVPAWDLPSARDILAAVGKQHSARSQPSRAAASPDPCVATLAREPAQWSLPAWLAWPPAALLVLALGVGGSVLAVRWSGESYNATLVHQRLLARQLGGGRVKPLPEGVAPPPPSWWVTTPRHLAQWGGYLDRPAEGERTTEEADALIDAAIRISPLHPTARLARARRARGSAEPGDLARDLGLSRDAASLSWSARVLHQAGKREAALRLYRRAFLVACHVERAQAEDLGFSDDPTVRRYLLPGESTALAILRELTGRDGGEFKEWSAAVPSETVAELTAARVLKEQGRPEADPLLDRLAETAVAPEISGRARAVRLAVRAEANALRSRWKDAEESYRRAIELIDDPTVRRSWWFNLADVASQLDDQRQRDLALQAALDGVTGDDISRRAFEIRRGVEPLTRLRPGGTKAN
jgi:tetratricopeptide (TPR) repeat protein